MGYSDQDLHATEYLFIDIASAILSAMLYIFMIYQLRDYSKYLIFSESLV